MNKHYDNYLVKKYAPLYRNRHGDMRSTAMCLGFEVGDGWFNLINTVSHFLCSDWLTAKARYEHFKTKEGLTVRGNIVTPEIVEQYRLKMIEEVEKVPVAYQVKEKFGGLRFYVDGATPEQYAYINFAESMSTKTCEVCGDKGKIVGKYWYAARCKKHENV